MEGYALYQHCEMAKRGLSLKRLQDTDHCPVIDDYLRLRQVIPEDGDVSVQELVKREVEYSLDKLRGAVVAEVTDGITTCWFLEDAETVTRLPFFFREKDRAVAPRTGGQSVTLPGKAGSWTAEDTRIVHGRIIYLMAQSREDKTVRCVVDADGNAPGYDAAGGFTGEIMEKLKNWMGNMKRFQGDIGVFARKSEETFGPAEDPPEDLIRGRELCGTQISVRAYLKQEQRKLRWKEQQKGTPQ